MTFNGGLGLRPTHYPYLDSHRPRLAKWFEVITENYFETQGRPLTKLLKYRSDFPIALHGVSLGIGSPDPVNYEYLKKIKSLAEKVDPFIISDHLCWMQIGGQSSHDLMPMMYTKETLHSTAQKIFLVQDFIRRPLVLENPSSYMQFKGNDFTEPEFFSLLLKQTGAQCLLDINNVYVSCVNFGWDPIQYISHFEPSKVRQIHLAGFTDMGSYLFDTHSAAVHKDVWDLYQSVISEFQSAAVMVEWDGDIPEFEVYEQELVKAHDIWKSTERIHEPSLSTNL